MSAAAAVLGHLHLLLSGSLGPKGWRASLPHGAASKEGPGLAAGMTAAVALRIEPPPAPRHVPKTQPVKPPAEAAYSTRSNIE